MVFEMACTAVYSCRRRPCGTHSSKVRNQRMKNACCWLFCVDNNSYNCYPCGVHRLKYYCVARTKYSLGHELSNTGLRHVSYHGITATLRVGRSRSLHGFNFHDTRLDTECAVLVNFMHTPSCNFYDQVLRTSVSRSRSIRAHLPRKLKALTPLLHLWRVKHVQ